MPTIEQLYSLQKRQGEIWRRIKAGSLRVEDALAATQGILNGDYPTKPVQALPDWYVDPAIRRERAVQVNRERNWGFGDVEFPGVPEDTTKLWLLVVNLPNKGKQKRLQRTVDEFWDVIEPPAGYTKYRNSAIKSDPEHLRLAPGYMHQPGIYWVEFDPDTYQGLSPEAALAQSKTDNVTLAGTEVLAAIWQFPDWPSSWFKNGKPAPNLSALQFRWNKDADWSDVLYVYRWDGDRRLRLGVHSAVGARVSWSSPSVRGVQN